MKSREICIQIDELSLLEIPIIADIISDFSIFCKFQLISSRMNVKQYDKYLTHLTRFENDPESRDKLKTHSVYHLL